MAQTQIHQLEILLSRVSREREPYGLGAKAHLVAGVVVCVRKARLHALCSAWTGAIHACAGPTEPRTRGVMIVRDNGRARPLAAVLNVTPLRVRCYASSSVLGSQLEPPSKGAITPYYF